MFRQDRFKTVEEDGVRFLLVAELYSRFKLGGNVIITEARSLLHPPSP